MDDADLTSRFDAIAGVVLANRTDVSVLARLAGRRRRRRRVVVATGLGAVAIVAGAAIAAARPALAPITTRTGPASPADATTMTATTSPPIEPAAKGGLVISAVPDGLAFRACRRIPGEAFSYCTFDDPATPNMDGVNIATHDEPVSAAALAAWDRGDATAAAADLATGTAARFATLAGRTVLELGITDELRVDGFPTIVSRTYEVLLGTRVVQLNVSGGTGVSAAEVDAQVATFVGGLGLDPIDLGFEVDPGALPPDAQIAGRGPRSYWWEPDKIHPEQSSRRAGQTVGITYVTPTSRAGIEVEVISGVDPKAYVDQATAFAVDRRAMVAASTRVGGRPATVLTGRADAVGSPRGRVRVLVVEGDHVLEVSTDIGSRAAIERLAAGVTVRP
ncbi:MAG: hypothetical protein JWN29_1642 [Acidimicrobiales bacterium]|nr:hypothetical protein [Acidimicrobiales bacterium]